jgi:hypothetical protein
VDEELVRVARGDIPARYADPLWITVSPDGSEAVVVLGINEEPYDDVEEVECFRRRGRWRAGSSSNGLSFGWTVQTWVDDGPCLGLLRLSGKAPAGVETVVVRWDGRDHLVPAVGGFFFFGVWAVPEDFDEPSGYPQVVRYLRSDGSSGEAPADPEHERMWHFERDHRRSFLADARARRENR